MMKWASVQRESWGIPSLNRGPTPHTLEREPNLFASRCGCTSMELDDSTRDEIAASLYEAHETGEPIDRLTASRAITTEDAYDIQSKFVDKRLADGATVVGHKVGLTSEGIQEQLGVDEPDFGRLLDTMFVDSLVPFGELIEPRVEPEIGFVIGERLDPPVTYLDVLHATHAVVPVLEIIDSRIRNWDIRIQDTIADNASSAMYLAGEQTSPVDGIDLSLEGVKVHQNGVYQDGGIGAAVLGHPARAVAWLSNTLADLGEQLEPGHIVLSGSFIPAIDLHPGDTLTVEFTTLGTVTARVSE